MLSGFFATQTRRIFRCPNYAQAFGLINGLRLLCQIERPLPHRSEKLRRYPTPGYSGGVHLRECTSDHSIYWQCLVQRQYDLSKFRQSARLVEQYRSILRRNRSPVILDAGGNIGLAALWFSRAFPEAAIVTVEPDIGNFSILKRNVANESRVRPVLGAVTEAPKRLRILNPDAGPAALRVGAADNTSASTVEGVTVDCLTSQIDRGELFIVKIDIEGGQRALFEDNTDWIDQAHLVIIELDDWQFPWEATSESFFRAMSPRRFDYLIRGENLFCFRHLV